MIKKEKVAARQDHRRLLIQDRGFIDAGDYVFSNGQGQQRVYLPNNDKTEKCSQG
jgi:hypothetical protein